MPVNDLVVGGYGNVSYTLHWNRALCAQEQLSMHAFQKFSMGQKMKKQVPAVLLLIYLNCRITINRN